MGHCKNCTKEIFLNTCVDEISILTNIAPTEGDYTICSHCVCISKFDKDLNLIPLTMEELKHLEKEENKIYKLLAITQIKILNHKFKYL